MSKRESEQLIELVRDMFAEFERTLNSELNEDCDDSELLIEELMTDFSMNTTYIHDVETTKNVYYNVRKVRDDLHDILKTVLIMQQNEKKN